MIEVMLAFLSGTITSKTQRYVILESAGFGFRVFMNPDAIASLPKIGEKARVFTRLHLRENETLELYGLRTEEELTFFELLLTVSGIGPKGALAILGVAKLDELRQAIVSGEHTLLMRVSGIGRKTAQKIILELHEKIAAGAGHIDIGIAGAAADALDALVSLGYSQRETREALRKIPEGAKTIEEKVKEALRILGKG